MDCFDVPVNFIVPFPAEKTPLLAQFPFSSTDPEETTSVPEFEIPPLTDTLAAPTLKSLFAGMLIPAAINV